MATTLVEGKENFSAQTRVTKDGRKITYETKVVQDPDKARACGQGAKSSTDRRPVDPPPIIQLNVFDEESEASGRKDITYSYRANFFMYADLEHARPQATNSRMARDANNKPVLCGAPVSGISYLDRPSPAGYFIFPDLSVRHEGNYRLSFTLWEDLKDKNLEDPVDEANPEPAKEHITARCNVKSNPFTVYSAKKFPGLAESTAWSRTVAEQGCRVRIRRDVRMRKRDTKDSKAWASDDDEEAEPSQPSARRPSIAERKPSIAYQEDPHCEPASMPRSPSHISMAPAQSSMQRASAPDLNAQYHQHGYPAHYMVPPSPQHGYPSHVSHAPQQQQYDSYGYAQQHQSQPVMQPPQQVTGFPAPPPPPPYGYGQTYYQSGYAQPYAYGPPAQMQSPSYLPPASHLRHNSASYVQSPHDYQAVPGAQQYPTPAPPHYAAYSHAPYGSTHNHFVHPNAHTQALTTSPAPSHGSQSHPMREGGSMNSLPPLQTHQNGHRSAYDAGSGLNVHAPPFYPTQQPPRPYTPPHHAYPPPPPQYITPLASTAPLTSKRSYGSTFDTGHIDQRLQSGARPDTNGMNYSTKILANTAVSDDDESEDDLDENGNIRMMEYKRADGTVIRKPWPKFAR